MQHSIQIKLWAQRSILCLVTSRKSVKVNTECNWKQAVNYVLADSNSVSLIFTGAFIDHTEYVTH